MKQTVRDFSIAGKTVLVRVDYNVPIENGIVGDTQRIEASFETINCLIEQNCKIILISHLGRPEGKVDPKYSLAPVARKASVLLNKTISFIPELFGFEVEQAAKNLKPGEIMMLENLRFDPGEETNDRVFAGKLAALAEVFVQDAFGAIHRAHASTSAITTILPSVAGLLVEKEHQTISGALENPKRPLFVIVGGAKISDKIKVLSNLIQKADAILIGGAMANTFLAAKGYGVGKSLAETDQISTANQVLEEALQKDVDIILPVDVVVADKVHKSAETKIVGVESVGEEDIIVDLGPDTITKAQSSALLAGTIIWNGPLGITEIPAFSMGSLGLAKTLADSPAKIIIGGGDTAAFINNANLAEKFDWVSTGGGATLDLMAGMELPGYESLLSK